MSAVLARPPLPRELYQPSAWGAAAFIGYAVGMFVIPAYLIRQAASLDAPLAARGLVILPLLVLAQQGIHLLGWVGHEGFHLSLHRNKYVSAFLGIFFSSMIVSFFQIGASISHWNHHRYTNQAADPDCEIFTRFKTFWSRLLFGRVTANRIYMRNTVKMALGRPLPYPYKLPFPPAMVPVFAWTNIFCSASWLSVYGIIAFSDPLAGLLSIALPHMVGTCYTGLRSYVEHAGTGLGTFHDSRTRTSAFFTFFYFWNNYHLEHHLYPAVPCYRLVAVHRYLKERGYYERAGSPIESTVLGAYAHVTSRSAYPEAAAAPEEIENPLVRIEVMGGSDASGLVQS